MTEQVIDLITLGGGALTGKAFGSVSFLLKSLSDARREAHQTLMKGFEIEEKSMDRASRIDGGKYMRRAIYAVVAFAFVAIIIAGWNGQPIIVENEVQKGMLFWSRTVTEYVELNGVPFLAVNKTAFLAMISFYFGSKV